MKPGLSRTLYQEKAMEGLRRTFNRDSPRLICSIEGWYEYNVKNEVKLGAGRLHKGALLTQ